MTEHDESNTSRDHVRWFAEECLGLERCEPCPVGETHWGRDGDGGDSVYNHDLTGWPGFGRVVEHVGVDKRMRLTRVVQGYLVEVGMEWQIGPDPAIAAIMALRCFKEKEKK